MEKSLKEKLFLFLGIALGYMLWNYLPLASWIANEVVFLSIKLAYYAVLAALIIILKHRFEIEIERPHKELKYLFLVPLIVCCLGNLASSLIFQYGVGEASHESGLLVLDLVVDLLCSIVEDLCFVDVLIAILLYVIKSKYKKSISILVSGLVFTAVHAYSFLYLNSAEQYALAGFQEFYVFFVTLACGYLAIYYDSAIIPVGFHFLFNALNHVVFFHFFEFSILEAGWPYIVFTGMIAILTFAYFNALWHMSESQGLRERKKE
ncbi:MAG: CPBP family intramembrane metalloprotease [Bacilli bacterium]|nr:CPBP family intramembrane metalloprotease [Bacilli bacterium]